jgi:peptidoglycan/LPS O-acetylase OafA/YrhL
MKERYDNLDGLRAYAAIGIVMMHVLANSRYVVNGFLFSRMIPSFTDFTFLFMVISAFSMCCGYYEKSKMEKLILNISISVVIKDSGRSLQSYVLLL